MNVDKGWESYPKAVYDIAINIRDNYNNIEWFVSENGMGVSREERYLNEQGIIEDDYRIQFIQEHLYWLHKGMEEGSNCFGYHLWTPIDCWSWKNAYRNRYGFISTAAKEENFDAEIFAVSSTEANNTLAEKNVDVLLLGPQVRFMQKQYEDKLADKGIPVAVINMADYGMMNGQKVLQEAKRLMNQ